MRKVLVRMKAEYKKYGNPAVCSLREEESIDCTFESENSIEKIYAEVWCRIISEIGDDKIFPDESWKISLEINPSPEQ